MKTTVNLAALARAAAFAAVAAPTILAEAVDMSGYEKDRLAPISQKSFEDLRDRTNQRIAEIRATPNTSISSSSWNTRYVSAAGNDSNNGQTPEYPWKTIDKVNTAGWGVQYVCFRRGDVFRGSVNAKSGVTYTAYGDESKPKPCIYVSPKNGADPGKWSTTNAPNVWCYKAGTDDIGTIVFDGGRAHAIKIVAERHTNATDTIEFTQLYTGEPFTNSYKDLAHDLHFWHDYTLSTRFKKYARGDGTLYLYSEQNPGRRFKSIEFCPNQCAFNVDVNNNVTIDNLCIKYVGKHAIGAGSDTNPTPVKNLKVTNCEFGWIGGTIQDEYSKKRNYPVRYGNAVEIYGGCDGFVVSNCYIYQVYDAGITQQFDLNDNVTQMDQKNIRYVDNVIEDCNYSIEYWLMLNNQPTNNTSHIENFLIADNIMWDAGCGFCEQRPITNESAHIKSWTSPKINRAKNFVIRDNVLACGKPMLVEINSKLANSDGTDSMPTMSGNVFIGRRGQKFGVVNQGTAVSRKFDDSGVSKICESYANNYFLTEPKRKFSLQVVPPGPHLER